MNGPGIAWHSFREAGSPYTKRSTGVRVVVQGLVGARCPHVWDEVWWVVFAIARLVSAPCWSCALSRR